MLIKKYSEAGSIWHKTIINGSIVLYVFYKNCWWFSVLILSFWRQELWNISLCIPTAHNYYPVSKCLAHTHSHLCYVSTSCNVVGWSYLLISYSNVSRSQGLHLLFSKSDIKFYSKRYRWRHSLKCHCGFNHGYTAKKSFNGWTTQKRTLTTHTHRYKKRAVFCTCFNSIAWEVVESHLSPLFLRFSILSQSAAESLNRMPSFLCNSETMCLYCRLHIFMAATCLPKN